MRGSADQARSVRALKSSIFASTPISEGRGLMGKTIPEASGYRVTTAGAVDEAGVEAASAT